MASVLRYRPHHFLCSLGFEGKGYSDAFTANMSAIVMGQLRAAEGYASMIQVVADTDDICAPCPKRRGTACTAQRKINRLDASHSAALRLTAGDRLTWGDAIERMKAYVQPDDLNHLCKGCSWLPAGMCKVAVSRLHEAPLRVASSGETPPV